MSYLEGSQFYGDSTLEDTLVKNTIGFLKQGFLELGAFYNIDKDQTGINGNDESKLLPVVSSGITNYTIYRGIKPDWVWETSGIQLKYAGGTQPYVPSGIYVNNTFYPTGTTINGTGYYIDFSRGRVVFNNPLTSLHNVQCKYSVRAVDVLMEDSDLYRRLNSEWRQNISATGMINNSLFGYLPVIFVGLKGYRSYPAELGSRSKWSRGAMRFTWFANNGSEFRKIQDNLYMLEDKNVSFHNVDNIPKPLNYRGELMSGFLTHQYLSSQYFDGTVRFLGNSKIDKIQNNEILPLRKGVCVIDLESKVNVIL